MSDTPTTVEYSVQFDGDQHERESFLMAINEHGATVVGSQELSPESDTPEELTNTN